MSEHNGAGGTVVSTIAQTLENNTSRKVFGEPVTIGDVTVIPAARVLGRGGGGGGGGDLAHGQGAHDHATHHHGEHGPADAHQNGEHVGHEHGDHDRDGQEHQRRRRHRGHGPGRHTGEGSGGGLVQSARPVGAFVVKGSEVSWRPALDMNRIILGGQVVGVVALLVLRTLLKRHHRGWALRQNRKTHRRR